MLQLLTLVSLVKFVVIWRCAGLLWNRCWETRHRLLVLSHRIASLKHAITSRVQTATFRIGCARQRGWVELK